MCNIVNVGETPLQRGWWAVFCKAPVQSEWAKQEELPRSAPGCYLGRTEEPPLVPPPSPARTLDAPQSPSCKGSRGGEPQEKQQPKPSVLPGQGASQACPQSVAAEERRRRRSVSLQPQGVSGAFVQRQAPGVELSLWPEAGHPVGCTAYSVHGEVGGESPVPALEQAVLLLLTPCC